MNTAVGNPQRRLDIAGKSDGSALYPQDYNLPGQYHAVVVWAAYPHAVVRRIDTSAAEALPGVVRVLTARDVPENSYGICTPDQPVLVGEGEKVRWIGDRIAIVIAADLHTARQARELVCVDYEVLPVLSDPHKAMQPGAPPISPGTDSNIVIHVPIRRGSVADGFALADTVVEGAISTPVIEHAYMQPEAGVGYIDDEGRVTVVAAAQWPADDLRQISRMLKLPEDRLREIVPAVGGAFGGREDMYIQHLLALAAYVVKHPVKMVFEREESILRTGKRHPFDCRYKVGSTRDGILTAVQLEILSDSGGYVSSTPVVLSIATSVAAGPYKVPNVSIDCYGVCTNNAVTMAMRGFGSVQAAVLHETYMDRLADSLGIDPVELRLKNLLGEGDCAITGRPLWGGVGAQETMRQAALAAGWREVDGRWYRPDIGQPAASTKRRGIGVAAVYKNVGYPFGFPDTSAAEVRLTLNDAGEVVHALIQTAAVEVGQGVLTALAQIAAQTLQLPVERIEMAPVDTGSSPDAGSSSASRHSYVSGNAVRRACLAALEQRDKILREETGETHASGHYVYRARDVRPTTALDPETGECDPHPSYSYGAEVALVEVDSETGETEVLKMWAAINGGRVINPATFFGQVGGGVQMGLGYALTEEYVQERGRGRSRRFSEYFMPTVLDMPGELASVAVELEDPEGPYGAKGMGETPTVPTAPAILNAIHDATGVRVDRLPANSERVWRALRAAR